MPSRVLLDAGLEASAAFAAGGTPMAVRIDAEGNVASPLAAGGDAVFSLLGPATPSRFALALSHVAGRSGNGGMDAASRKT